MKTSAEERDHERSPHHLTVSRRAREIAGLEEAQHAPDLEPLPSIAVAALDEIVDRAPAVEFIAGHTAAARDIRVP